MRYFYFLFLGFYSLGFSQTTIYLEDFTGQNGKGAFAGTNPANIDVAGVDWSIDVSSCNLGSGSNPDYFFVLNEQFEGEDTDGNAIWYSPMIAISGYSNVSFSLDASEVGTLESSDIFLTEYRLNAIGPWVTASNNGNLSDDFNSLTVSQTGLSGTTLEIRIIINNNADSERHRFDNVLVTGFLPAPDNDLCANATAINCGDTVTGDTTNATNSDGLRGRDVFYSLADTSLNEEITVSLCGSAFDTFLNVFDACSGTLIASNDDSCGLQSQVTFLSDGVSTYIIQVDGFDAAQAGAYNLEVNCVPLTDYCSSSFTQADADAITNVSLNDFDNSSGDAHATNANGYEDFTALTPTDLERGQTYNLEVTIDPNGLFQYDVWAFIDWNGDFIFDESFDLGDRNTPGSLNADITVPFTAELGNTRLRVIMINNDTPVACDPQPWVFGETEDYTINIINPTSYCTALGDTTFDTSITEVTFNGTTNTSSLSGADDPTGYIAFATPIFQATQGEDYTLSVNLNTDGDFTVHAVAWIDWNQDFIFDPVTERYDLGEVDDEDNAPTNLSPLTINVPANALPGETRMRIVSQFLADPAGPCAGSDDGEIEDYTINVTPITYVYNNGWLPANPEGVATIHNPIEIQSGNVTLTSNTSCEQFTIAPGNNLTINSGVTLTVQNGLTLQSVSNNYAGLILNGTINGTVNYQRFVNVIGSGTTSANDLVSAPLSGQTFGDFAAANNGVLAASGNLRAWAPFNNTSGTYQNYNVVTNANTVLEAGMGYRAATTGGDVLSFTGTVETGTVSRNITVGPGNFKEWNLIGNPYTAYISMEAFLQHEVAPGVTNLSLLDNASGIYGYDGTAQNGWDVVSLANATGRFMAPGQGFFVAADEAQVGSYDIEFTPDMRVVANGDDFIPGRTAPLTYLKLEARRGNQTYQTQFYFNANAGNGLDAGYDAQTWGGTSSGFILYSHLVADNTGVPMALQALHPDALNEVRIPLGINASSGNTIIFSIAESQLPAGTEVYLEDTVNNSFTLLNQSNYQVTLQSGITGTGRFFLRFGNGTLSNNDVDTVALNIYHQPATATVVIAGLLQHNSTAHLYDLQGRMVRSAALNTAALEQHVDVSGLSTGVYVLSFEQNGAVVSRSWC